MLSFAKFDLAYLSRKAIETSLLTLFFFVPLIFIPITSELFEFNKMFLVHFIAAVLITFEALKLMSSKLPTLTLPKLRYAGLLFLLALTLSTIFSIDQQVSFFGYPGRFHGGLWSYLSYAAIFYSLSQQDFKFYLSAVKVSLVSATLISIWGILEHFGHSPSCLVLSGNFDADCWVQDVKARVFATLGHPNWLAAYLAMILPWSLSFYTLSHNRKEAVGWLILNLVIFSAFVFTYSRGGTVGLLAALAAWLILNRTSLKKFGGQLLLLVASAAALTFIFASPATPTIVGDTPYRSIGTLEAGDETGQIRLIVWRGAWEIFKHYPVLGSGVETFGEIFYKFRPLEMNQTGEWDFLFNKAHNEYLNFLATTGLVGTLAYLLLILSSLWQGRRLGSRSPHPVLGASVASSIGYLVQNAFGFTVVPLALVFVLNLAALNYLKLEQIQFEWPSIWKKLSKGTRILVAVVSMAVLVGIFNWWRADLFYARGVSQSEIGNFAQAEISLKEALALSPNEPNYLSQLALSQANLALEFKGSVAGHSLSAEAKANSDQAIRISPYHLGIWRLRAQVFEIISGVDGGSLDEAYLSLAVAARKQAVNLAPTEPKVRFELAKLYLKTGQTNEALDTLLETLKLKDNYLEPMLDVIRVYLDLGQIELARTHLTRAQMLSPENQEVKELSSELEGK